MRKKLLGCVAVVGLALVAGQGIAVAQSKPKTTPQASGSAGLGREVSLSPAEQLQAAEGFLLRFETVRNSVRKSLGEARAQRDVVKVLCLDDKLNQVDVAIRGAKDRKQALEGAVKRNDADLANHEFTIMTVLRQRVDQLSAEANQCIGQEAGFIGESSVSSTIDPTLPDDPSDFQDADDFVVQPPACASCIK